MKALLHVDKNLSAAIHHAAATNPVTRRLSAFGASDLIWIMFGVALGLSIAADGPTSWSERYLYSIIFLFCTVGLSWLLTLGLEYVIKRKRPFQEFPNTFKPLIHMGWTPPSFPSGHAAIAVALAIGLGASTAMPVFFLTLAAIISLCRVAVGVHYVSDIVVGALVGVAVSSFVGPFVFVWILILLGVDIG